MNESIDSLRTLQPDSPNYAIDFVDRLLQVAINRGASDIHLQPTGVGIDVDLRLDGVINRLGHFPVGQDSDPVVRLKVLGNLLTYKTQVPQEGRLAGFSNDIEMRLSTFPTVHGERAVVRLFSASSTLDDLQSLNHSADIATHYESLCGLRDGAVLITGPAGSGKTTTLYAMLRRVSSSPVDVRTVLTIEDPVESVIPGISQSQLEPALGMTLDAALRSMLRQDPEVIMVGEIRDPATAEAALQASLTGHLVFSTLHGSNVAAALRRLEEMDVPPYLIRSGLRGIASQRLVRKLCSCNIEVSPEHSGLDVKQAFGPLGCQQCHGTGYAGRIPISELLRLDGSDNSDVDQMLSGNQPASEIYARAIDTGMIPLEKRALDLVENRLTSPTEVHRVLGASALK